jgi:hypothetical protein
MVLGPSPSDPFLSSLHYLAATNPVRHHLAAHQVFSSAECGPLLGLEGTMLVVTAIASPRLSFEIVIDLQIGSINMAKNNWKNNEQMLATDKPTKLHS